MNIKEAVFKPSIKPPSSPIQGFNFNNPLHYPELFNSYSNTGFQATNLSIAINIINMMLHSNCKIYLGFTSNLVSSGLRDIFSYLVQHNLVDIIVTTAGGIEEDFIKCLADTHLGDFHLSGKDLRKDGLNRAGNLLIPNDNYCKFEDWVTPHLDEMLNIQKTTTKIWSPSSIINHLGEKINNQSSIYHHAYKNNIPVFCPAITDGSLGDMIYFHSIKSPGLIIDLVSDIKSINNSAVFAKKTGMIILGGGVTKHHICNANLMRNGADYAVYINTGLEFDGSDSGASPDEAVSWGKIRVDAESVKVHCDATLIFPIIVAMTFHEFLKNGGKRNLDEIR